MNTRVEKIKPYEFENFGQSGTEINEKKKNIIFWTVAPVFEHK